MNAMSSAVPYAVFCCICRFRVGCRFASDTLYAIIDPAAFTAHKSYDLPVSDYVWSADQYPALRLSDTHVHSFDTLFGDFHLKPVYINRFGHT